MSPDYPSYSLDELYDALENINKDLYPENYTKLLNEISSREHAAALMSEQQQQKQPQVNAEKLSGKNRNDKWSIPPFNIPSSSTRILGILASAILGSSLVVISAEPSTISLVGIIVSASIATITGGALIHSFVCGWTLSKHGIITLQNDKLLFTVAQLFYSYLTCFITMLTIARLP